MTAKEFMEQANRLDNRINAMLVELEELRKMAGALSQPCLGDHVSTSLSTEAPFEQQYMMLVELEEKINAKIDRFVKLKEEISEVIDRVPDPDERTLLHFRYLLNMPMREIAKTMHISEPTLYRWHTSAMEHVVVPEKYR